MEVNDIEITYFFSLQVVIPWAVRTTSSVPYSHN
jgi:hypothetical protein